MQKYKRKQKKIRLTSLFFTFVFILCFACTVLTSCNNEFSYLKSDLEDYVQISETDYKNFIIEIPDFSVSDADVERKIMGLLTAKREAQAANDGTKMFRVPITFGDEVYIYYRGYTVDENGIETDIDGACNFFGEIHELGIGSASFVKGIEEGLIGKVPKENATFSLIETGNVQFGDVIYVSYQALLPNGKIETATKKRIDLSDSCVDSLYGEGFGKSFLGKAIGETTKNAVFGTEDGSIVYSSMKVEAITRCENLDNVITVDAYFPADYREETLRAKWVKFDIYI